MKNETFTLKDMNEAYIKLCEGEKLTKKEKKLALAKRVAVRSLVLDRCRSRIKLLDK